MIRQESNVKRLAGLLEEISACEFVVAILLVGSRALGRHSGDSDYDLHIVLDVDIPTVTFHHAKPLRIDVTIYDFRKIHSLHVDRKLEIGEARILYQRDQRLPGLFDVRVKQNWESTLHWIRFHLRHLKEDILKSKEASDRILSEIRYLYHACEYKYTLTHRHFRGFKRLDWTATDCKNFIRCFKAIGDKKQKFLDLANHFIGKSALRRLSFEPRRFEIETCENLKLIKNNEALKRLSSIILGER
jgi:predicted nucleotidyltransferase